VDAFLIGILSSIIAATILALTRDWWRETRFATLTSATVRRLVPEVIRRRRNLLQDREKTTAFLTRWLRRDQSRRGQHTGEFGRYAALKEERKFQNRITDFASKPRLYLTGWPSFILYELDLSERLRGISVTGMERLLASGSVRARANVPTHPESVATVISLRHTFRAVQILYSLAPSHPIVVNLIGQIIDPHNRWRRKDGGWPPFETDKRSDLWATAYGVALLHRAEVRRDIPVKASDTEIDRILTDSIEYLKDQWRRNKWRYAKASSAHNGIQIYHEVFDCLRARDTDFLNTLSEWVNSWLTPSGTLSNSYLQQCGDEVTLPSGNARIAYALF
jgi:hypothetical protein